ncbi:MAG: hypothetical protein A2Y84_01685 [Candidatus Colwellbacteria bacterium RBG_13_48_8]|uniref:SHS2 domain-containing protein n=1 Tax=Candidatus Colwellbacteria bacterium RBG_13_48_8 TaxID=1797685 RepID=A0A1G1YWS8_9BACT|nr:MAG: hypothetical protein A2Y84_01685 [Candidatus Colwellbacteria bacterium RBG_13_48_8]
MLKDKIFSAAVSLLGKLSPKVRVAGLQINGSVIRFCRLSGAQKEQLLTLRLPPGIVEKGEVKNKEGLIKILTDLHKQIEPHPRKSVSVILTIPIDNVYLQPITLPDLPSKSLIESVRLNLEMVSPIEIGNAYYDWQAVGQSGGENPKEIIGAFVNRRIINDFLQSVQAAGFNVAAVEFSTLSLVRVAVQSGFIEATKPSLLLEIDSEGLSLAVSHAGSLFFHYFVSWDDFRGNQKDISLEKYKEGLADEIRKITNFYSASTKIYTIKDLVLVSTSLIEETKGVIAQSFPQIQVRVADTDKVNPALGVALRSLKPRSQDFEISLSDLSTEEVFENYRLTRFISAWRNIILTISGFLLVLFLASAVLFQYISAKSGTSDPLRNNPQVQEELLGLERQAETFNNLLAIVGKLSSERSKLYGLLIKLRDVAGQQITLNLIDFESGSSRIALGGVGVSERAVADFKNRLIEQPQFEGVSLSLSNIRIQPDGQADFTIDLRIRDFNF